VRQHLTLFPPTKLTIHRRRDRAFLPCRPKCMISERIRQGHRSLRAYMTLIIQPPNNPTEQNFRSIDRWVRSALYLSPRLLNDKGDFSRHWNDSIPRPPPDYLWRARDGRTPPAARARGRKKEEVVDHGRSWAKPSLCFAAPARQHRRPLP